MKRTVFSLIFYTMGLAGLFLADLLINYYFSNQDVKTWVLNKSLMMMAGPLLLLGYNNNFLRYPEKIRLNLKLTFKLLLFWLILAFIVEYLFKPDFSLFLVVFFAFNLMLTSFLRINRGNLSAQINQSVWKILLFFLVFLVAFFEVKLDYFYCYLLVFLCIPTILIVDFKNLNSSKSNLKLEKEDHKFAHQMLLSAMLLNIATYGELFLLAKFYPSSTVSDYFLYLTLFTASGVFVSGFLGFYLTPKIRKDPAKTIKYIFLNKKKIYALILIISLINFIFGVGYLFYAGREFDIFLIFLFLALGVLKILYIWPTSRMGALANSNNLKEFLLFNVVITALYILILIALINFRLGLNYIVILVFANWLFRVWIANKVAKKLEVN